MDNQIIEELLIKYNENPSFENIVEIINYYDKKNDYFNAFNWCNKALDFDNALIYSYLSIYLSDNRQEHYDPNKAVEYANKAIEKGFINEYYILGDIYLTEFKDYQKALELFNIFHTKVKSNQKTNARISECYYRLKDYTNCIYYGELAYKQGNKGILFLLGLAYSNKRNPSNNYQKAIECYNKLLEYDDKRGAAYNNLGLLYENGYGVEKDEKKAFELYLKGYQLGNTKVAYKNVARCYRLGIGCEVDIDKAMEILSNENQEKGEGIELEYAYNYEAKGDYKNAIEYYKKSAAKGSITAKIQLGLLYKKIIEKKVIYFDESITKEAAFELFNDVYLQGMKLSETEEFKNVYLENCFLNSNRDFINEVRKRNDSTHYDFSQMVGNKNYTDVYHQIALNEWCLRGVLGAVIYHELNDTRELDYLLRNCEKLEYSNINYLLGRKYEIGYETKQDYEKAYNHYLLAIKNAHPMANSRLGFFYQHGIYVEKDLNKAKEFHLAAANDCLIGDTSINYRTEYRGIVESHIALGDMEEEYANKIDEFYSGPNVTQDQLKMYNKKAIYQKAIIYYDNACKSKTLIGKTAYVEFYLRHPDLFNGNNLDEMIDEIKDNCSSFDIYKYFYYKNDKDLCEKIKLNIINSNDKNKITKLYEFSKANNLDLKIILFKLGQLGDEKAYYEFNLLDIEKDSEEYKNVITNLANEGIYEALIKVIEFNSDPSYLHKVLDDERIISYPEISRKYRPILGDLYYKNHQYLEAAKYLEDEDKKAISLYLSNQLIDNTFLKLLIDELKPLFDNHYYLNGNKDNGNYLLDVLNKYIKKYNSFSKEKDYYKHLQLLGDKKEETINHLLKYISNGKEINDKVYHILVSLLYTESFSLYALNDNDTEIKMIKYRLGMRLSSYYCSYNYAYLLYKNNPGLFKASIRKEAIKIMDKIQYYFEPAYKFLLKYEKKYVKEYSYPRVIDENLLIIDK